MEELPAFRRRMRRTGLLGTGLVLIFVAPLLICALKSSYVNAIPGLSELAASCYRTQRWIQHSWDWPVFPAFSLKDGFGLGDAVPIAYLLAVLFGFANLSLWWSMLSHYQRVSSEARDARLRDGF